MQHLKSSSQSVGRKTKYEAHAAVLYSGNFLNIKSARGTWAKMILSITFISRLMHSIIQNVEVKFYVV